MASATPLPSNSVGAVCIQPVQPDPYLFVNRDHAYPMSSTGKHKPGKYQILFTFVLIRQRWIQRWNTTQRNIFFIHMQVLFIFLSIAGSIKTWSMGGHAKHSPENSRQQHSQGINQTWSIRILQRGSKGICDSKATHQNYSQLRSQTGRKWVNLLSLDLS